MFVKSLTLKGFKSFASATSMRLEPGITCIVGPNGSGKSNVVDALAWVMGEQGAKTLRGGKMEDVIFAGTPGRPALGRAEVTLTIDNTDGALPIDYTEVTISRTMFRSGGSEYAINGTNCRLLDVQELLSDSGIGREMHVIVGQGQLDAVLRATPEERRGFIEEAAGVLKHRKRKERALRKLETMEANLHRVGDLTTEIRRQLGPLGRQAETARKAATIQADVRDARLRLLADDLVQLTSALEQDIADEEAMLARQRRAQATLDGGEARLAQVEEQARAAAPALTTAQEQWFGLSSLAERIRATETLAAQRVRLLAEAEEHEQGSTGRDPEQLRAQAAKERARHEDLLAQVSAADEELAAAVARREAAEGAHQDEQQRVARLLRAAADRREGLAKLEGQVAARRSRIEAAQAEIGRLEAGAEEIEVRATRAEREFAALESGLAEDEEGEQGLDAQHERAEAELAQAQAALDEATQDERTAEQERSGLHSRLEALELGLRRGDGAAHLLSWGEQHGVRGSVASLVQVEAGREVAVAAALGWAADAVVVADHQQAAAALQELREADAGRAGILVAHSTNDRRRMGESGPDTAWAYDVVSAPDELRPVVDQLLAGVLLVEDPAAAAAMVARDAKVIAVTRDGDVFAADFVRGGSAAAPSTLEIQAAVDDTKERMSQAASRGERARFAAQEARAQVEQLREQVDAALERLGESDARMAAVAEQLGQLGQTLRSARSERERGGRSLAAARESLGSNETELQELQERLEAAHADPGAEEPDTDDQPRLAAEAAAARSAETEHRLTLRSRQEQARALEGRAEALEATARSEVEARRKAQERRERRRREALVAAQVRDDAGHLAQRTVEALAVAQVRRDEAQQRRTTLEEAVRAAREVVTAAAQEVRELTDSVHRDELARAEQRLKVEAMQTRAVEEHGIAPEALVEEFGPHLLIPHVPGPDDAPDDAPEPVAFVREHQEKRLRSAERKLAQLGRVNPLALEEFAALEERHTFLTTQLDDLTRSKKDLFDIVREVDERVERVFAEAFADTAREFEGVFDRLFPGGEGRLTLTEPGDMLTTGIEVEARPPGKKIKRLSLLSGGERSLVAVALLVSIFKARPSPFYIMDEVEAALDDANLGRLITLFQELRDSSQLIVITHQKRTMEVADALYGVSMRGDGITTVVSQRLRDVAPEAMGAPAPARKTEEELTPAR
ncbi:chromosome segregation protein SMC [Allobranchiibius sp. GilTou73]|uniref:chromosome segregation protein SMC n=1 Tax=Allobranchiibius sp. GilTou73 TaxID=2904523 RepID=UPI001F2883CF|nr:chromosome segregation protein SMC [Allobranchiibius sp. GilTou73]UIJ34529.1 chromosome segregation protein SMC [Allobranchiibius sp. GilTou73]